MSIEQNLELKRLEEILSSYYDHRDYHRERMSWFIKSLDALIEEKTTDDDIFFRAIYDSLREGIPRSSEARLTIFRKYAGKLRKYEKEEK